MPDPLTDDDLIGGACLSSAGVPMRMKPAPPPSGDAAKARELTPELADEIDEEFRQQLSEGWTYATLAHEMKAQLRTLAAECERLNGEVSHLALGREELVDSLKADRDRLALEVVLVREACAEIADEFANQTGDGQAESWVRMTGKGIAMRIRALAPAPAAGAGE